MSSQTGDNRTYGNWRRPTSPGVGNLGLVPTVMMFVGLVVTILATLVGGVVLAAFFAVVLAAAIAIFSFRNKDYLTLGERALMRISWMANRKNRAYRSGPIGRVPTKQHALPGLLASTELSEHTDSYGRAFALLRIPQTNTYSVVLRCDPDGHSLVDQSRIDQWVGDWGGFMAGLGHEPGVVAASATIEAAPDTGERLRREVERQRGDAASRGATEVPELAAQMLEEAVRTFPQGSASLSAYVTITFRGRSAAGKRRSSEAIARDLAARMPKLTQELGNTGAGAITPASASELCEVVRIAYDPAAAMMLDAARADQHMPTLQWQDCGPSAVDKRWDSMRHDSAWSVTYQMTSPPRGLVYSNVLQEFLAPHGDIDRKRVTLLYRPLDPARAAKQVEADIRTTRSELFKGRGGPSARAEADDAQASATAREEARGAGLVNFGLVATATVLSSEDIPEARAAMDALSGAARLQLRIAYGAQDAAFASGLPLGLVLPDHLRTPATLRDNT